VAEIQPVFLAFNRGVVSPLALGRVDIKRLAMSAARQENWEPRVLGPMSLRSGTQYITNTHNNNPARYFDFVFSVTDTALIELTDSVMRVIVDDVPVTRVAVGTVTTNGNFTGNITGWTNSSATGCTSAWTAGGGTSAATAGGGTFSLSGNFLLLTGDGTNAGAVSQTVVVAAGDVGKAHGLRIVVAMGTCELRVGSAAGLDDYIGDTTLGTGAHSLQITPTGDIYIKLLSRASYPILVQSVNIEAAGVMTLPTPWPAAVLDLIRMDQSGDVLFCATQIVRQQRIERRGVHSWSIVDFVCDDGPFLLQNVTPTTLTPASSGVGNLSLASSLPFFQAGHVGALFRLTSSGQNLSLGISSANTFTNPIKVTGLGGQRALLITISGTWVGTVTLQSSFGAPGAWNDVTGESWIANVSGASYNDGFDNQIIYYRLGIKTGNYTSGTANVLGFYSGGSSDGIGRITSVTTSTQAFMNVIKPFGSPNATKLWYEGSWSDVRGYPSATKIYEGRLWWAGTGQFWGSLPDQYESNDDTTLGDSGPINRSIGSGPVDTVNWLQPMLWMLSVGCQTQEWAARSDSLGNPITPTNFNLKEGTSQGTTAIQPKKVDYSLIYVGRTGSRVFNQQSDPYSGRMSAEDLTVLAPEVCQPQVTRMALQRNFDTRVHFVRSDGAIAMLVFEDAEAVKCWATVTTQGTIEDVITLPALPGQVEDTVYYSVARVINGSTVRFLEKRALQSDCVGGNVNKQADAFLLYSGAPTTVIGGLSYLQGATVVCWADGLDQGTFVVSNTGTITLPNPVSNACIGLGYQAVFESAKMSEQPIQLTEKKRISRLSLVLKDAHYQGLQFGTDLSRLDDLPLVENEVVTPAGTVWPTYDNQSFGVDGEFDTDARLYLVANAPRPCTVLAAKMEMTVLGG